MYSSVNSDYNNDIHSWLEIERQVAAIAKAGFTHTQWIHDWEGEYLYSPSELVQVRDLLRHYNINCHTIHSSEGGRRQRTVNGKFDFVNRYRNTEIRKDYTSTNEYTRLAGVDLLKNRIDLCAAVDAHAMVLHMQLPWKMFEESAQDKADYYRQVCKSLDEVKEYAKAFGVKIALENLICTPWAHQEEEFERMFDRYDDDFLGFCFDSGHATLQCRDDYYYPLRKYCSRLIVTHLQDNDSISEELASDDVAVLRHDAHRVPYSGVIDWDTVAQWLAKAPVELPCDFEVGISAPTPEEELALLVDCREKSEKFNQLVADYRKQ